MFHKHLNLVLLDIMLIKRALLKDVIGMLACRKCHFCRAKLATAPKICTSSGGIEMVLLGHTMAFQFGEPPGRLRQQHQASLIAVQPSALQ